VDLTDRRRFDGIEANYCAGRDHNSPSGSACQLDQIVSTKELARRHSNEDLPRAEDGKCDSVEQLRRETFQNQVAPFSQLLK
jgi:hypothetical protein